MINFVLTFPILFAIGYAFFVEGKPNRRKRLIYVLTIDFILSAWIWHKYSLFGIQTDEVIVLSFFVSLFSVLLGIEYVLFIRKAVDKRPLIVLWCVIDFIIAGFVTVGLIAYDLKL